MRAFLHKCGETHGVHAGVKIHAGVGVLVCPWVRDDADSLTRVGNTLAPQMQGMQTRTHRWRRPGAKGCADSPSVPGAAGALPPPPLPPRRPSPSRPARPAPRGSAEGGGRPGRAEEKEAAPVLPARRCRASPQLGRGGSRARARGARTAPHRTDLPAAPEMRRVCTLPLWLWLGIVSEAGELPGLRAALPALMPAPHLRARWGRDCSGGTGLGASARVSPTPRRDPHCPPRCPSPRAGMCRALALPVPGSPIPAGTGTPGPGHPNPGRGRVQSALGCPVPSRRCPTHPQPGRAAVPARVSPTAVPACPQRQDGTGGPCCGPCGLRGRGEPTPCSSRGCLAASGEKPHGTLAGGMSQRGDASGWRAGWRAVPALCIYFFTHRVINLCVPGRKAREGGGPCKAVQPACPSSGPPRKSPEADPSEMLSLPLALLGQKAVG